MRWNPSDFCRILFATLILASALTHGATAQSGQWAWVSGGSTSPGQQNGVYGTLGVPSSSNVPGARAEATSWTDTSGNLWLFGGSSGATGSNASTHFNDLWAFNPATKQWVWMSGLNNTVAGVYGTLGVPASGNVPGARQSAMGWADSSGNIWLFGGWGYDSAKTFGNLNDLWKFIPQPGSGRGFPAAAPCPMPTIVASPVSTARLESPLQPMFPVAVSMLQVGQTQTVTSGSLAGRAATQPAIRVCSTTCGSTIQPPINGHG